MAPSADSAGVKVSENDLLQEWQKYSCVDMIASVRAGIQEFLDSVVGLIKTATAICDNNSFTRVLSRFRMAPSRP